MSRIVALAALGLLFAPPAFLALFGRTDDTAQAIDKTITTAPGPVGELLRQWWAQGTTAGNAGDVYDNRDGGHSELKLDAYPQLKKFSYTAADVDAKRHWGMATQLRPGVVFGNSSTSAPPTAGGSVPRMYYVQTNGINFLFRQYVSSNLYVYPEHRDHDPGHNGVPEGYGDLYPTNTPYLIISQGSSGSDQPFLRALPFALAALKPEVKKKLIETGMLMPTMQMLLRSTNRQLAEPGDYLTGTAHPTVFEGSWVNELELVKAAHALELDKLPPLVVLKVLEEEEPVRGRDFFELSGTEKLADTPSAIARIVRGKEYRRRMVISAQQTIELNKRPVKLSWAVLRGDKNRIQITPRTPDASIAEINIAYHERRPVAPGSALESNRVDIGVFAHNGVHFSPPSFITFYSLDSEARAYDASGRVLEIGYGMGQTTLSVASWPLFLHAMTSKTPFTEYLGLSSETQELFRSAKDGYGELQKKKASTKELDDFIDQDGPKSVRAVANNLLWNAVADPQLLARFWNEEKKQQQPIPAVQRMWMALGLLESDKGPPALKLVGKTPTSYERMLIERGNARLLAQWLIPNMLTVSFQPNYVDERLAAPKDWRDVYHYDERGECTGWRRYNEIFKKQEYTADGLALISRDELGRVREARVVRYTQEPRAAPGGNPNPLRAHADGERVTFEYASREDRRGRAVRDKQGSK